MEKSFEISRCALPGDSKRKGLCNFKGVQGFSLQELRAFSYYKTKEILSPIDTQNGRRRVR
jgi:hypothetical protein